MPSQRTLRSDKYKTDNRIGIAAVTFTLLVVLFNPVIPVYPRDKGIWMVLELLAATLLAILCYTIKGDRKIKNRVEPT